MTYSPKLSTLILFLGIFVVVVQPAPVTEPNEDNDFDYFVFRQIWPASTCMFPEHHTCKIPKNVDTWVVHGLWPSIKAKTDGPFFCNKSLPFDPKKLDWIMPRLEEFWPNLYTDTPFLSFWKHEWLKHGTCALSVPDIKDESDYFNVSLNMREHYDFGPILKGSDIIPDDSVVYDLDKIKYAIKSVLGVTPGVICYVQHGSTKQYLSQMQICLSKDNEQTECQNEYESIDMLEIMSGNKVHQTDCINGVPVVYPTIEYKPDRSS